MHNMHTKCVEKFYAPKNLVLSVEIYSWLCQLMNSLNPRKIALSCRIIISTCRMMVLFVLRDSLDPKDVFYMQNMYEQFVEKILRAKKETLSRSEKGVF